MSYSKIERGVMAADVVGRHFVQISNDLFRDPRISGLAKAVFALIATHRDGYGISVETIARHMKEGVGAIKKALRELERYGYLVRVRLRDERGRLGPSVYRITDMPDGISFSAPAPYPAPSPDGQDACLPRSAPADENPPVEKPTVENRPPKKTKGENTNLKNTSSSPNPSDHASATAEEPEREEEVPRQDTAALELVDAAVATWVGHRPPTPPERLRLAERVAQALREGAQRADLIHALSRDLSDARSAVAVVMARTKDDGWWRNEVAPAAVTPAPRPKWCGVCDERTRQREDAQGRPYRCPECHPLRDITRRQDAEVIALDTSSVDGDVIDLRAYR